MLVRFIGFIFAGMFLLQANATAGSFGSRPDVKEFIAHMVQKHHFNRAQLQAQFNTVKLRTSTSKTHTVCVPLESKPWYTYQALFVNEWRIRHGVAFWNRHRALLERVERKYHVPASLIVATIGVETKYGKNVGKYRIIDALSEIAFSHSPRAGYFRYELEQFFLLAREQHMNPLKVMGSYAGAIGQPQFMPDSYRDYAVNFSGRKGIDLVHDEADIIASVANYYHKHGWEYNEPVALQTSLKGSQYLSMTNPQGSSSVVSHFNLSKYGISSHASKKTQLIALQNFFNYEYWIGFHNFNVIKRYNSSNLYAMAVYQLSYYITESRDRSV